MRLILILALVLGGMAVARAEEERPMLSSFYANPQAMSGKTFKVKCDFIEHRTPPEGEVQNPSYKAYWAHVADSPGRRGGFIIVSVPNLKVPEFEKKYQLSAGSQLFTVSQTRSLIGRFSYDARFSSLFYEQ